MQLTWVSGPTARVRTINITRRRIVLALITAGMSLVLLGMALHFIGFRIALSLNPELVMQLGGVTTQSEQEAHEAHYRQQLGEMQSQLIGTLQRLHQIEALKNQFMDLVTPPQIKITTPPGASQGGPLVPLNLREDANEPLIERINRTQAQLREIDATLAETQQRWQAQYQTLVGLPLGVPVQGAHSLASGYGMRTDPITGQWALHEGLDFVGEPGTPIVATGQGVVSRSAVDPQYGQVIEVQHDHGLVTRYAHLKERRVNVGQTVDRGQVLGLLGSSGRSTGPHLHYEVLLHERAIDPRMMWARSAPH